MRSLYKVCLLLSLFSVVIHAKEKNVLSPKDVKKILLIAAMNVIISPESLAIIRTSLLEGQQATRKELEKYLDIHADMTLPSYRRSNNVRILRNTFSGPRRSKQEGGPLNTHKRSML